MKLLQALPLLFSGELKRVKYKEFEYLETMAVEGDRLYMRGADGEEFPNQALLVSDFTQDWEVEPSKGVKLSELHADNRSALKLLDHLSALILGKVDYLVAKDNDGDHLFVSIEREQTWTEFDEDEIIFLIECEDGSFERFEPELTKTLFNYNWEPRKGEME